MKKLLARIAAFFHAWTEASDQRGRDIERHNLAAELDEILLDKAYNAAREPLIMQRFAELDQENLRAEMAGSRRRSHLTPGAEPRSPATGLPVLPGKPDDAWAVLRVGQVLDDDDSGRSYSIVGGQPGVPYAITRAQMNRARAWGGVQLEDGAVLGQQPAADVVREEIAGVVHVSHLDGKTEAYFTHGGHAFKATGRLNKTSIEALIEEFRKADPALGTRKRQA